MQSKMLIDLLIVTTSFELEKLLLDAILMALVIDDIWTINQLFLYLQEIRTKNQPYFERLEVPQLSGAH